MDTLGLGSALKIMLFYSEVDGQMELASLSRIEIITCVSNAAYRAKRVGSVPEWRDGRVSHCTLCGVAGTQALRRAKCYSQDFQEEVGICLYGLATLARM